MATGIEPHKKTNRLHHCEIGRGSNLAVEGTTLCCQTEVEIDKRVDETEEVVAVSTLTN